MKHIHHRLFKYLLIALVWYYSTNSAFCQNEISVSRAVMEYNGKNYYLHRVEEQQTLSAIARAYGIPAESILLENPDARKGLRSNQVLRIPVSKTSKGTELTKELPHPAPAISDEYEYVYHVAGRNENFRYLAGVYLVQEALIRNANKGMREPFREGEYVLVPISKKQAPTTETENRFKRSNYDPYLQNNPQPKNLPDPSQLISSNKVVTVSPFDSPLNPVGPPEQTSRQHERPASSVRPETPVDEGVHVVKPNETLQSIASSRKISPEALLAANPGINTGLRVGQVLKLPDTQKPVFEQQPATDTVEIHIVGRGETLFRISRQYGVSVDELRDYNPGLTQNISVGQKIRIPKKKITDNYLIYRVTERQKAKNLSREFGLSPQELQKANPSMGAEVFPNQKLRIPTERKGGIEPVQPVETPQPDQLSAPATETSTASEQHDTEAPPCEPNHDFLGKEFKIALLLPLYLEKVDAMRLSSASDESRLQPLRFLPFYKGFIMAADSLARNTSLRTVIRVFDVDQSSDKINRCLQDPWMKQADLIVGPFHSQPFAKMAEFAKNHGILIVNPMSNRQEILTDNPFVVKIKPDPAEQFSQLAALIADRYPNARIFIYHPRPTSFAEEALKLQKVLQERLPVEVKIRNSELARNLRRSDDLSYQVYSDGKWLDLSDLQIHENESTTFSNEIDVLAYSSDSLRYLRKNGSSVRTNLVIAIGDDRVFAMEMMNKLNQVAENFPVKFIGLPEWDKFDNLFIEIMQRLDAHFINDGFIAYDQPKIKEFIARYREKFQTEPDEYAFEGFDIAWAFLNYLGHFGPGRPECLSKQEFQGLQTHFHFKQSDPESGIENTYWNFYKLENYANQPLRNAYFYP